MEDWSDREVDTLRRLWSEGASAMGIAFALGNGRTRNAVVGKIDRLGLLGKQGQPIAPTPNSIPENAENEAWAARQRAQSIARRKTAPLGKPLAEVKPAPPRIVEPGSVEAPRPADEEFEPLLVSFADLTDWRSDRPNMCRWIFGEPRDPLFCGMETRPGYPYCPRHVKQSKSTLAEIRAECAAARARLEGTQK